jgi:MYXO-CTERM domain-containing protein
VHSWILSDGRTSARVGVAARAFLGFAGIFALFACSGTPEVDSLRSAIVNGELSDDTDASVVEIYAGTGNARDHCSASLIAPNVIVTALHCVAEFDTLATFTCNSSGALTTPPPAGAIGAPKDPESITVHLGVTPNTEPDAVALRVFGSGTNQICRNDFAIVVLDRDLDAPLAPIRLDRHTRRGELVRAVGYGSTGMSGLIQRHVRHAMTVTAVGEERDFEQEGVASPNTLVVTEGPCQGDSGGPAISEETGAVIGVYSISAGRACTSPNIRNVFTNVAPFHSVIQEAMEYAGYDPILEPPEPEPLGGTGGQAPEPVGGSAGLAGTGTGGASGGRAGAAQGGDEPDDPGSGSREDASCACRVTPAQSAGRSGLLAALVGFGLLLRRRRRNG